MEETVNLQIRGFRFAAAAAGIKKSGKLDLGLIVADRPVACAAVYTTNKVVAAPVEITRKRLASGRCQAVLVNSGNANACTGKDGEDVALKSSQIVATLLGIAPELVAVASTGVIGQQMPLAPFTTHLPDMVAALSAETTLTVAEAIRTTDAYVKVAAADGDGYRIAAIAKGAGMIHPNMATMLAFVMTDAVISPELLDSFLRPAVDASFNSITVDRDTSTNDMVLLMASGEGREISAGSPEAQTFGRQLNDVLLRLAKMIVRDGEGATKLVTIQVNGARDDFEARQAACAIATSNLVKTAFFGEDANWGRIIAAAGYSGSAVDPDRVSISFDQIEVVKDGLGTGAQIEAEATKVLKQDTFTVTVDLGLGTGTGTYYTSDLGYDYVRCNASYRS